MRFDGCGFFSGEWWCWGAFGQLVSEVMAVDGWCAVGLVIRWLWDGIVEVMDCGIPTMARTIYVLCIEGRFSLGTDSSLLSLIDQIPSLRYNCFHPLLYLLLSPSLPISLFSYRSFRYVHFVTCAVQVFVSVFMNCTGIKIAGRPID